MGNGSNLQKDDAKEDLENFPKNGKKEVIAKLLSSPIYKQRLENEPETLNKFAQVLATPEDLKDTYLTTDWVKTVKFYDTLSQETENLKNTTKENLTDFSSKSESTEAEIKIKDEDEDGLKPMSQEILQDAKMNPELQKTEKNKIKIKLVIAEVAQTDMRKNFRQFISPILSTFDLLPEFGMFHSAILIGPWLLEWNNSALCIPRKCVSKAAFLTADIDSISSEKKLEEVIDHVANFITHWNVHKTYKDNPSKDSEGNCQDFVHDLLDQLGVKTDHIYNGSLGEFLKKLRKQGKCDMEFHMDHQFRTDFELKESSVKFKTHKDLDVFVQDLKKKDLEFEFKYKSEMILLKSFDRAFWLRHFKFPSDDNWKPLKIEKTQENGDVDIQLGCPFDDPQETNSIRLTGSQK
eukprot:gene9179-1267_t